MEQIIVGKRGQLLHPQSIIFQHWYYGLLITCLLHITMLLLVILCKRRKPDRFQQLLLVCMADSQGRLGFETAAYPQLDLWQAWLVRLSGVSAKDWIEQGLQGKAIKEAIATRRLVLLEE